MESIVNQASFGNTNQRRLVAFLTLWIMAIVGLGQAELVRAHLGLTPNWFSMSFYFLIPALLWTFSIPLLQRLNAKIPMARQWKSWLVHISISFGFVFTLKFISLVVDFSIQSGLGLMHGSLISFLFSCKYLFLASLQENLILYWAIMFFLHFDLKVHTAVKSDQSYLDSIIGKTDEGDAKIPVIAIMYIEAFGNYVKVHTVNKTFCIRGTLKEILRNLAPQQFLQVHRSIIINHQFINSIKSLGNGNYHLELIHQNTIRTGRQYKNAVRSILPKLVGRT